MKQAHVLKANIQFTRLSLSVFIFSASFSHSISLAKTQNTTNAIRIQIGAEPSTLDPTRVIDQNGIGILRNMIEGLFVLDSAGQLQKGLVDSYEISTDHLTYKFRIKPEARWSDGIPVQISDFVLGLHHAVDPKTASPDADSFFAIKNARAIAENRKPVSSLGVQDQDGQLVIELERKDPSLELELSLPAAAPLRSDIFAQSNGVWSTKNPVTGPYTISSYKLSSQIRLEPNPFHKPVARQTVIYDILPEEVTALNLFEAGHIDIISTVTPTEMGRLSKLGLIKTQPSTTVFYFSFNLAKAPFNDIEFRKAVSTSVDRAGLAHILNGGFIAQTSFLPTAVDGSIPYLTPNFKSAVSKVRQDLKKPRIHFAYAISASNQLIAEKIQQDLRLTLGLQVVLEPMEPKSLLARLATDPPEMYLLGKSAMYNDPINHLNAFINTPEPNFAHYLNTEYEDLVGQIKSEPLGPRRTALAREANRILIERDIVAVPILLKLQVFGVSKAAQNFAVSPYQVIQLDQLTKANHISGWPVGRLSP